MSLWPRGFWSAVQFLTRIPIPARELRLEAAYRWFPLVGLLIGSVWAALDVVLRWLPLSSLVVSALLVVFLLWLTGALHADGLMDTCDAAFAHATPERRLEIMRDPCVGAFAVGGLLSVMLLKVAAIEALPPSTRLGALVLAPGLGRWSIVILAALFPYGRPTGLGAPLKSAASARALVIASIAPVVACSLWFPTGILLGAVALIATWLLGRWLASLLPGLTGDSYGAVCEMVEVLVLLVTAPLAYALA